MTVSEVKIQLSDLQDEQRDLLRRLEDLIESGDDPDAIEILQRAIDQNSVRQYAAKSKILRLSRQEQQQDRETAITTRDQLEEDLKRAAIVYEEKLRDAEAARLVYQTIGLRLGSLDSRIELDRQAINERQQELAKHISNWKTHSMLPLNESVCDY